MIEEIPSLNAAIRQLQQIPYLASKNLYRVVDHFLHLEKEKVEQLCHILMRLKTHVTSCQRCFCLMEVGIACAFCSSTRRDQKTVCVVETWQEVVALEKTKGYSGVYHVLQGVICPLEGMGPEDLTIEPLLTRVSQGVEEIILATNQTPEGEATASYLANSLKNVPIKISCLSRGLPVGAWLESMDRLTLYKALSERRLF